MWLAAFVTVAVLADVADRAWMEREWRRIERRVIDRVVERRFAGSV